MAIKSAANFWAPVVDGHIFKKMTIINMKFASFCGNIFKAVISQLVNCHFITFNKSEIMIGGLKSSGG